MTEFLHSDEAGVTDQTCGICLDEANDPLNLPCGHSFCGGCLDEWRSRYGVEEEMRSKCPTCRARIPPSKEMAAMLQTYRAVKKMFEDSNEASSSKQYHYICRRLAEAEKHVGPDWDKATVLEDNREPAVAMPGYINKAVAQGEIKIVLHWINADRTENRANAISSAGMMGGSCLLIACVCNRLRLMTILLQLGADVNGRARDGSTAMSMLFRNTCNAAFAFGDGGERVRLLLSWGAAFFPDNGCSRGDCISRAKQYGKSELSDLLESELGGRRCEIVNLSSRPELNGKTCVANEYLPVSNQYRVTLEKKSKEVLLLDPNNLRRRNRTSMDCGYHVEFKYGRTIRHDFDSNTDCQAFVAALKREEERQPAVTEEAEARAEQAAAELLAELGPNDDTSNNSHGICSATKSEKKKGGKRKKTKKK